MASRLLTTASTLKCPHNGTVTVVTPANTRARVDGSQVLTSADVMTVTGCPFSIGPVASPCVSIQWVKPDARLRADGPFTLSEQNVGLCIGATGAPQGTVIVQQTQNTAATSNP